MNGRSGTAASSDKDVGKVVKFLASKHWGETALADSGWLIPNTKFKTRAYTDAHPEAMEYEL